jgi:hypothetical protein
MHLHGWEARAAAPVQHCYESCWPALLRTRQSLCRLLLLSWHRRCWQQLPMHLQQASHRWLFNCSTCTRILCQLRCFDDVQALLWWCRSRRKPETRAGRKRISCCWACAAVQAQACGWLWRWPCGIACTSMFCAALDWQTSVASSRQVMSAHSQTLHSMLNALIQHELASPCAYAKHTCDFHF